MPAAISGAVALFPVGYNDQLWDVGLWDATRPDDASLSAVAFTGIEGTVALTTGAASLSLTATETFSATATLSGVAASLDSAASETFAAAATLTGAAASLDATAAQTLVADVALTAEAASLSAEGTETLVGVGDWTSTAAALAAEASEAFVDDVQFVSAPAGLEGTGAQTFTGTVAVEVTASAAGTGLVLIPIAAAVAVVAAPASLYIKVRRRPYAAGADVLDLGGYSAFVNAHQPEAIQDLPTYHDPEFTPAEGPASVFVPPTPYVAPVSTLMALWAHSGTPPLAQRPEVDATRFAPPRPTPVAPAQQATFDLHAQPSPPMHVDLAQPWQGARPPRAAGAAQQAFRRHATKQSQAAPQAAEAWARKVS